MHRLPLLLLLFVTSCGGEMLIEISLNTTRGGAWVGDWLIYAIHYHVLVILVWVGRGGGSQKYMYYWNPPHLCDIPITPDLSQVFT